MSQEIYNIYIDECCHTPNNGTDVMGIGATIVAQKDYLNYKQILNQIKLSEKLPTEIKWSRLNTTRKALYVKIIDFFFAGNMEYRSVLIKNKSHAAIKQDHNDQNSFYYKSLAVLLKNIAVKSGAHFNVFLDIKDTRGRQRIRLLKAELKTHYNDEYPFIHFQHIDSKESPFLQIADLFVGAMCFKARKLCENEKSSAIKKSIVDYIEEKSGYDLADGTEPWEQKFFILDFKLKP